MTIIRWILGRIILFVDFLYRPPGIKRDPSVQASLNKSMEHLTLYQYKACPFCVKVRWAMKRNALNVKTLDAKRDKTHAEALTQGGGQLKVPCLKIDKPDGSTQWMYESNDIIRYLERQLVSDTPAAT